MNTNALRLFLHIVQRGSLVAAATELNMSQSAASRLLTGLEREAGLTLFSRDRQRLRPTAEGEQYFNECYRVLVAVDELPKTARRLASGAKARLRLLTNPRFATTLMSPALGRFLQSNPDIDINLQVVQRNEVELMSSEHSFDLGVIALPLKHASVKTEPLLDMPATAIMRRDHRFAKRTFVRLTELADQRLVATPPGTHLRRDVDGMFAAEGLELRPQLTVGQVDIACNVVLQADAIMISDPLMPLALNAEAYAVVPVRPLRALHVGIASPALNPASRLTTLFALCLREEAKAIEQRLARRLGNPDGREALRPGGAKLKARRKSRRTSE